MDWQTIATLVGLILIPVAAMMGYMLKAMDKMENRINQRFDRVEARMDRLEARMDRLEDRINDLDRRLAIIETVVSERLRWSNPFQCNGTDAGHDKQ